MKLSLSTTLFRVMLACLVPAAASLPAQGVGLKNNALVFYGEASNCTQPAVMDFKKVAEATPEHKKIKAESIDKDSAQYKLLASAMLKRIKKACKAVAEELSKDLVVRAGDISDQRGLAEADLTEQIVKKLEEDRED
jgi:hypothetical protein